LSSEKTCPVCNTKVNGRSDKIFCSIKCKSIRQYETRQKEEQFFLNVDKQLKINRKILKKYNKSGYTIIRSSQLVDEGFNPKFFTHFWKNKKGDVYLFVYEFGFLKRTEKNKQKYLLVN